MKAIVYRIAAFVLLAGAVIGLLLNVVGLYYLWSSRDIVASEINQDLGLISSSLKNTSDGLDVAAASITNARDNLKVIRTSLNKVAQTIQQTEPVLQNVSTMMGYDLPNVVASTRQSLNSAAESAKVVDNTLKIISSIPLIGTRYKPDVPLQQSIIDVSNSLRLLPDSFVKVQKSIDTAGSNMQEIKSSVYDLAGELNRFDNNLIDAQTVVSEYQNNIQKISARVERIQDGLPTYLSRFYILLSLVMIWLVLVQLAMFIQGIDLLSRADLSRIQTSPRED